MKLNKDVFNIEHRLSVKLKQSITPESFQEDWNMWSELLVNDDSINSSDIIDEIEAYDFNILHSDNFGWEELAHAYSRFVSYNLRITSFITKVSPLHKSSSAAYKNLKDIATELFTGTDKQKTARAIDLVQPFAIKATEYETLMDFLLHYKDSVGKALDTMNRLAIDRQSRAKFDYKLVQESNHFARVNDQILDEEPSEEIIEENGEVFTQVKKIKR